MTKAKAIKLMKEHSREVVEPTLASKITQAFGFKLSDLDIKPKKVSDFHRLTYSNDVKNLKGIAVYYVAMRLAEKITGVIPTSLMHGFGSMAEDITEKSILLLSK
jgi:hypothetical protein